MPVTHTKPDASHAVHGIVRDIIADHYPMLRLLVPSLQIGILFVTSDDPEARPALKHHGWPAGALIRIVNQRDRAAGGPDVLLQIDGDDWPKLSELERVALVDHELLHIEFPGVKQAPDDRWFAVQDALTRPIVKLRHHDFELGGFWAIVDRYGSSAPEKRSIDRLNERLRQQPLPFGAHDQPKYEHDAPTSECLPAQSGMPVPQPATPPASQATTITFKATDMPLIANAAKQLRKQARNAG